MAVNYAYNYAEVQDSDGMCVGVTTGTTNDLEGPTSCGTTYVSIPVYDEEYIFKYYINGNWYEDAEGTIPWTSSLL
jgi:hypothetical protein